MATLSPYRARYLRLGDVEHFAVVVSASAWLRVAFWLSQRFHCCAVHAHACDSCPACFTHAASYQSGQSDHSCSCAFTHWYGIPRAGQLIYACIQCA